MSTTCKWIRCKSPCFSRSLYYHKKVFDLRYTDGHPGQVNNSMSFWTCIVLLAILYYTSKYKNSKAAADTAAAMYNTSIEPPCLIRFLFAVGSISFSLCCALESNAWVA
jgi:hypothetical protein